jgi:hypothetical protein
MANKKISDLVATAPVVTATVNDQYETVQGGVSKGGTLQKIIDLLASLNPFQSTSLNVTNDVTVGNSVTAGGDVAVGGNLSVGTGASILPDGSATFANLGDSMTIDADGTVRIAGAGISALYTFFRDGTGFLTTEIIETSGDVRANTVNVGGANVVINASGNIQCASVAAGVSYTCNGLPGVTGDFVILVAGVPKTFHFEGGILTSVT